MRNTSFPHSLRPHAGLIVGQATPQVTTCDYGMTSRSSIPRDSLAARSSEIIAKTDPTNNALKPAMPRRSSPKFECTIPTPEVLLMQHSGDATLRPHTRRHW